MVPKPSQQEVVWLRETVRRIRAGLPVDEREMMVALRDQLPRGFVPSAVSRRLVRRSGPTLQGLRILGDSDDILEEVERAIRWVKGKLIADPHTSMIGAEQVAAALGLELSRAQRLLELIGTLDGFIAGSTGPAGEGYANVLVDLDEIVAKYLAFDSLEAELDREAFFLFEQGPADRERLLPSPLVASDVFVLMNMNPADESLVDVLNGIKSACTSFGLEATRIDEEEHADRITDRIIERIKRSDLIIADLSGERPNVYYEVGFAHALGKRPMLYRRRGTPLHFDLAVHNVPEYGNVTELRSLLHRRLEAVLGRSAKPDAT